MADRAASKNPGKLIYLYGITREPVAGLRVPAGVDGVGVVEAIRCDGLTCWVSKVDASDFGDALSSRMENLEWLAAASVRHQRVVGSIFENTTILPARFATIFRTQESLREHLRKSKAEVMESFRRLDNCDEYGIKIFAAPAAPSPAARASSGRDYLKRKSELLAVSKPRRITPELERFIAGLQKLASESTAGGSVSTGQRNLLWQGSLLLRRPKRASLDTELARFSRDFQGQYHIECTGPWPPYSFIRGAGQVQGG